VSVDAAPQAATAPKPAAAAGGGLFASLQSLLQELPGLVSDRVTLASLELRRAGHALVQMLMLAVAAAILGVTAWLALWVGVGAALIDAGLGWGWALLIIVALNVGAAFFAVKRALALVSLLGLPATVRRLTVARPSNTTAHERFDQPVAP
jgi:uncharacterized membrane protein YqjE